LFEENHIHNNGSDGVNLRPERESNAPHRNTFVRNIIENNGIENGGYGFSIHSPARDLIIKENIFRNTTNTQRAGIYMTKNALNPKLVDNIFDRHEKGEVVLEPK
jgi:hypothetical protein